MQQFLTIIHILAAVFLILLVLIQKGKGSEMGAGFGAGASQTMFGSQGATPFLVKLTGILAFVFFITCSALSFFLNNKSVPVNNLPDAIPIAQHPIEQKPLIPTEQTQVLPQSEKESVIPSVPLSEGSKPLQSLIPGAVEQQSSEQTSSVQKDILKSENKSKL
ncbi:MAG: hypothetical protein K0Q74_662 [Gammaproteobacteria bacterium]|jgi:preprotein translocase subunit SecG|nr:hypothetical protein [Gammaproteobacteria bacterium]